MRTIDKIINDYVYASKLFNTKYKNDYMINVFMDFNFLNIYLHNIQDKKYIKLQILNNEINDLIPEEILKAYEELIEKLIGDDEYANN